MRVLIATTPFMCRQTLATHGHDPDFEVPMADPASLDGQAEGFGPHLLVRNDTDGVDMDPMGNIRCWIEILYSNGMEARVSLDGEVWNITDITTEDLLEIADRTEELMLEGAQFG
jgi:hypothetical protein